ncbi:hypothetical protein LTR94_027550, partial [Friedmanniomyces endolithicus]
GRDRRPSPQPDRRRTGRGGAAGEALRKRHGRQPDHHRPRSDAGAGAGADGRAPDQRHSGDGEGRAARWHPHQPRRALRRKPAPAGRRADDARQPRHRFDGRGAGGGAPPARRPGAPGGQADRNRNGQRLRLAVLVQPRLPVGARHDARRLSPRPPVAGRRTGRGRNRPTRRHQGARRGRFHWNSGRSGPDAGRGHRAGGASAGADVPALAVGGGGAGPNERSDADQRIRPVPEPAAGRRLELAGQDPGAGRVCCRDSPARIWAARDGPDFGPGGRQFEDGLTGRRPLCRLVHGPGPDFPQRSPLGRDPDLPADDAGAGGGGFLSWRPAGRPWTRFRRACAVPGRGLGAG